MESASIRRLPALPGLVRLGLSGCCSCWPPSPGRHGRPDGRHGRRTGHRPGTLGFFVGIWVVMMAAMMFPSIAPMVLMHCGSRRAGGSAARAAGATALFVAGYLVTWAAAGLVGYGSSRSAGRDARTSSPGTTPGAASPAGSSHGGALPAHPAQGRLPRSAAARSGSCCSTGVPGGAAACGWGSCTAPGASDAAGR